MDGKKNMTNEEKYMTWLATKVKPTQLSEYYVLYKNIEEFCHKIKILQQPLFETFDYTTARKIQQTTESNKVFRIFHKRNISKYISAVSYYCKYIKELEEERKRNLSDITQRTTSTESKSLTVSNESDDIQKEKFEETINAKEQASLTEDPSKEVQIIDFYNIPKLVFTKPISFSYFGEEKNDIKSWTDLYTTFFSILYEDYSHIFKIGMSFSTKNNGRVEFGDAQTAKSMRAPKPINTESGEICFIETNLNANDIVGKIKTLLDLCAVDYENIIIQYTAGKFATKKLPEPNATHNSCASYYTSGVKLAEAYAKEHNFEFQILLTDNRELCLKTVEALFQDEEFVELNKFQHNRFRVAITKLLESYGIKYDFDSVKVLPKAQTVLPMKKHLNMSVCEKVLADKFIRGFRIGSSIEMKKFRRYYEEVNGEATDLSDADVESDILDCSIRHDGKAFAPATMLPAEEREKLFSYIRTSFNDGKQAIYYEALFRAFNDTFLNFYIYDAQMLKAYIAFYNDGEFHLEGQYICEDSLTQANPLEEIKNYIISVGAPVENTTICATLSHIPQEKLMQILGSNGEFVNNGKSWYFHVDIMHLSEEEIEGIANLMKENIDEKMFISGNELIEILHARYPSILENNPSISAMGMRDALKHYLKDQFSFKGNIISSLGSAFSMSDVFGNYAKNCSEFTLSELATLASELNSTIYYDAVYGNSLRISKERFVAKSMAQFRIDETDRAIDRFCSGDYISVKKVDGFGSFPDAGFPWNIFLLENYVYAYSEKYHLLHTCFNRDDCVGAIVKNTSGIRSFDDLLANALAYSTVDLTREQALNFFVEQGYLARRMYSNIEKVLIQANTYRNRKGTR